MIHGKYQQSMNRYIGKQVFSFYEFYNSWAWAEQTWGAIFCVNKLNILKILIELCDIKETFLKNYIAFTLTISEVQDKCKHSL